VAFDPTDEKWAEGQDGEFWRFSGETEGVPWRCTIRWMDGGWTQLAGLELGEVIVEEPNLNYDSNGRASGVDRRGAPVPFRPLDSRSVHGVIDHLFHSVRDAELGAALAAVLRAGERDWENLEGELRLQAVLGLLGGIGQEEHAVGLAAAVYSLFVRRNAPDPTLRTAEALHISRATAARRVRKARDLGLLGAAKSGVASAETGSDAPRLTATERSE